MQVLTMTIGSSTSSKWNSQHPPERRRSIMMMMIMVGDDWWITDYTVLYGPIQLPKSKRKIADNYITSNCMHINEFSLQHRTSITYHTVRYCGRRRKMSQQDAKKFTHPWNHLRIVPTNFISSHIWSMDYGRIGMDFLALCPKNRSDRRRQSLIRLTGYVAQYRRECQRR